MKNSINSRIYNIRQLMHQKNIDAYIIPSSDPHQSEYVADHWKSRQWVSGFAGSAGTVVITKDHAGLWTDSRYFIQAEQELSESEMELHKLVIPHTAEHLDWIASNLPPQSLVAFDGACFSVGQVRQIAKKFYEKKININSETNLIDIAWENRPSLPLQAIFDLDIQYAGQARTDKISQICDSISGQNCTHHLVTTLDDIAWIFNIRSNDIECNPVSIAYAILAPTGTTLFIDSAKVPTTLKLKFQEEGIYIRPYETIESHLKDLEATAKILVDPKTINNQLYNAIPEECIVKGNTISTLLKAKKNPIEIENIHKAMLKDGIALTKLYRWLEKQIEQSGVSEVELAEKLHLFRKEQGNFFGDSFDAIVGYKGNGAIVHYRAQPDTCATIQKDGILLLDSGGQYFEGTTDITRTVALGTPTAEQKCNFTLVLKGHIGLAQLKFPVGTRGNQMEILARQHLWQHGLNYGHGTGHGVGFFLNVHEGPQSIGSGASGKSAVPLEVGMLTSNEPGFYKTDEYGIRIENLILTVEAEETDFGTFLQFESVTLFPIDQKLIDFSMLTKNEIAWLNDYHAMVEQKLCPHLNEAEQAWMKKQCKKID